MRRQFLIYFLLLYTTILACKPHKPPVACPGYEESTMWDEWFPYETGDVISFSDTNGNIKTMTIGEIYETESHFVPPSRYLKDEEQHINCSSPSHRITSENYFSYNRGDIAFSAEHVIQMHYGTGEILEVWINGSVVRYDYKNGKLIPDGGNYYDSIELNNRKYYDVAYYNLSGVNPYNGKPYKYVAYLAKGIGIISYCVYPNDSAEYWLQ